MAIDKAANKGNKFQNLKLDFATVKKMSMSDRVSLAKDVGTQSLMASLTPEEYSRTFPKYYSDVLPSVGKSLTSMSTESYGELTKRERGISGLNEGEETKAGGPKKPSATPSGKSEGGVQATTAAKDLPEGATALLNTISGRESGGDYNIVNFMAKRQGLQKTGPEGGHPFAGQKGYTAAGRYQFLASTWKATAESAGLDPNDFSPENQDRAAWHLAKQGYRRSTKGRSLEDDIKDPKNARMILDNLPDWKEVHPGVAAPKFSEKTFLKNMDKEKEEKQQAAKPGEPKPSEVAASASPEEKQQSPEEKTNDERKSVENKEEIPSEAKNIQVASAEGIGTVSDAGPPSAEPAMQEPTVKTVTTPEGDTQKHVTLADGSTKVLSSSGEILEVKPAENRATAEPTTQQAASVSPSASPAGPVGPYTSQPQFEYGEEQRLADIENAKPTSEKKKITMEEAFPGYKKNPETGKLEKIAPAESDFPGRGKSNSEFPGRTQTASAEPAMKAYTPSPEMEKMIAAANERSSQIDKELDAEGVKYQGGKSRTYLDAEGNMVSKEEAMASDAKNKGTMQQATAAPGTPPMPEPDRTGDMKSPSFDRQMERARFAEKSGEHYDEGASNLG